jgi:hypothetical protein
MLLAHVGLMLLLVLKKHSILTQTHTLLLSMASLFVREIFLLTVDTSLFSVYLLTRKPKMEKLA